MNGTSREQRMHLLAQSMLLMTMSTNFGCGDTMLRKYSQLNTLRVLSMAADTPDVGDSNATVTISPVVSDESGGARSITQSVTHCTSPDLSVGAEPSCDGVSGAQTQSLGTVTFSGSYRTSKPTQNQFTIQVPANYLQSCPTTSGVGPCSIFVRTNGRPYLVVYKLTAGTEVLTSIRRIFVKDTSISGLTLNSNPVLSSVTNGSADLNESNSATKPSGTQSLTAVVPGLGSVGGPELFSYLSSNGGVSVRAEDLLVSWFTNVGEYKFSRTVQNSANEFKGDTAGSSLSVVVVLRDGRGGEASKVFQYGP